MRLAAGPQNFTAPRGYAARGTINKKLGWILIKIKRKNKHMIILPRAPYGARGIRGKKKKKKTGNKPKENIIKILSAGDAGTLGRH